MMNVDFLDEVDAERVPFEPFAEWFLQKWNELVRVQRAKLMPTTPSSTNR